MRSLILVLSMNSVAETTKLRLSEDKQIQLGLTLSNSLIHLEITSIILSLYDEIHIPPAFEVYL